MRLVDRFWFGLARAVFLVWDGLLYRTHPHIPFKSAMTTVAAGVWVERCECWCGCRCVITLTERSPVPAQLPASADWELPPVEGWPADLDRRLDWRRNAS